MAIDPKGVIGPAAYEVGPLLMNPLGFLNRSPMRFKSQNAALIFYRSNWDLSAIGSVNGESHMRFFRHGGAWKIIWIGNIPCDALEVIAQT